MTSDFGLADQGRAGEQGSSAASQVVEALSELRGIAAALAALSEPFKKIVAEQDDGTFRINLGIASVLDDMVAGGDLAGSYPSPTLDATISTDVTWSGDHVFNKGIVVNESGGDNDTRFEGDGEPNLLYLDAGNGRIGIGTATPSVALELNGAFKAASADIDGALQVQGETTLSSTLQVAGNLAHEGSNAGFFGKAPAVQQGGDIAPALSAYGLVTSPMYFPPGHIYGAQAGWQSASQVTVGTSGERSYLRDSTNTWEDSFSGVLTADITGASGAGSLDVGAGAEAADTWYALHMIMDSTGSNTPDVMLSTSATAPVMPSGYDKFRRVGWVRNDGSSNFLKFKQSGNGTNRQYFYDVAASSLSALLGGTATVYTAVDLRPFVPPTSKRPFLMMAFQAGATTDYSFVRPTGSSVALPPGFIQLGAVTAGGTYFTSMWSTICTDANQSVDYLVSSGTATLGITVHGFGDSI